MTGATTDRNETSRERRAHEERWLDGDQSRQNPDLERYWPAKSIEDRTLLDVNVKLFRRAEGDSVLRVGEHMLGQVLADVTVTTRVGGAPARDLFWPAHSIGFLPAGMRLETHIGHPLNLTVVRMARRFFEHAAFDSIEPDRKAYRYLHGVTDQTDVRLYDALRALATDSQEHEWPLLLDTIASGIAVRTMQLLDAQRTTPDAHLSALSSPRLRRVLEYIEANIARHMRLAELADIAALSPYHFARAFRTATGVPPMRFVWRRRVERAKWLMQKSDLPLALISFECGFSSQSHFTSVFKRETGVTPSQYRANL